MGLSGTTCVALFVFSLFLQGQVDAFDHSYTNLKVRYYDDGSKVTVGMWTIPMTVAEALEEGYVKAGVNKDFPLISLYCLPNDTRAFGMYSMDGRLSGFRIGVVRYYDDGSKVTVGMWTIPMTVAEALEEGYVKAGVNKDFPLISLYCLPNDTRAFGMYSMDGRLSGFRIGYIYDTLSQKCNISKYYYFEKISTYQREVFFDHLDTIYTDFFFTKPEYLKDGGCDERKNPLGDYVYAKLDGKNYIEIPQKESEVLTKLDGIKKHGCLAGMGTHYFYVDGSTPCACLRPFFAMYHEGLLVSIGMVAMGSVSQYEGAKNPRMWYEDTPIEFPGTVFQSYPACLDYYIKNCGAIGLHMYLTPHPEEITC